MSREQFWDVLGISPEDATMRFTPRVKILITGLISLAVVLFLWPSSRALGQEIQVTPQNLDLILLIDNSTSMIGNDPERLRIKAAKFLMDYLRASSETMDVNYWVGVANFGGREEGGDAISLRLLKDDTVRDRIHGENLGQTDFGPPLQFARNELRADFGSGKRMAVFLFTDGRPQLTDTPMTEGELESYFGDLAPLVNELQSEGVLLFVLGIGDAQKDRENWTKLIPQDHYIPIASITNLADVYLRLVAELIGLTAMPGAPLPAGQEVAIQVEPYLEQIDFSFMKSDPASRITLINPQGALVAPTTGGTADVYHQTHSVSNPPDGVWKASWEGEGNVQYWVDRQYPAVQVDLDAPFPYTGQPITITASMVRSGVVVTDPLRLEAEIVLPDGTTATRLLASIGDGKHVGIFEEARTGGTYTVTVKALLAGQVLTVRQVPATVAILSLVLPPTSTPQPTGTPTPSPTLTPTLALTATPTPTSVLVGPAVTPMLTPMIKPEGVVIPWGLLGVMVLAAVGLASGLIIMALLFRKATKKSRNAIEGWEVERVKSERELREKDAALETIRRAREASELEEEADRSDTLLRAAREALSKGDIRQARRLAEQVIENAVRYGEAVLDRMAADVGKALDIIRQTTKNKEEWADILFKYFHEGSIIVQCGLASALKVWWANYPNEATESIYALISIGGHDILRLVGEPEASWPGGGPEIIKNNAQAIENICKSLHSLLARKTDENLLSLLDEVANALGAASETFAHAGDAQALYQCMAQLAEHPLWPVEFPALSGESLPYFRNMVQLLKRGFTLPSPAWEGLPQLKQLEWEVSSHVE